MRLSRFYEIDSKLLLKLWLIDRILKACHGEKEVINALELSLKIVNGGTLSTKDYE